MDTIFMNSENSKTSEYHVLVLKLTDKLDLRRGQKLLRYQILVFIIRGKYGGMYVPNFLLLFIAYLRRRK